MEQSSNVWIPPTQEQFSSMTPDEKRVTIARDVIAALNNNRYKAKSFVYVDIIDGLGDKDIDDKEFKSCPNT